MKFFRNETDDSNHSKVKVSAKYHNGEIIYIFCTINRNLLAVSHSGPFPGFFTLVTLSLRVSKYVTIVLP